MSEKNYKNERPLEWILLLIILGIIYYLGAPLALLNWVGYQAGVWLPEQAPFYLLVFIFGALAVAGMWYWKRWGVISMGGVWAVTALVNRYFNVPVNLPYLLFGIFLVIWFLWVVRRYWRWFT